MRTNTLVRGAKEAVAGSILCGLLIVPGTALAGHGPPPANTAPPALSGVAVVGDQLSTSTGMWSGSPTSFTYKWLRCTTSGGKCTTIVGASASSFTLTAAQVGATVRSQVTAFNLAGHASADSAPSSVVTVPPPTPAVAYQLNPAHTGASPHAVAANPTRRWSMTFTGGISYPLIYDGNVYVTVADSGSYGTKLYALSATTGALQWGPVELGGTYDWSGIAADAGRIYAVNYSGALEAFDAGSGALDWSTQLPNQWAFTSPPTAYDGYVYTGGAGNAGTVYAVNESTGTLAWTASVENGDESSPAVSSSGVYVSYACGQTYDFQPLTGALIWHRSTACEGGGGKTPVLAGGDLYVRDSSYPAILAASSGATVGPFVSSGPAPSVDSSNRYVLEGSTLTATSLSTGFELWSFSGDGTLSSAPIVAGGTVVIGGTSGALYGLSASTGTIEWSTSVGSAIPAPDEQNVSQPLTGLAESGGLLIVPAGNELVAYR